MADQLSLRLEADQLPDLPDLRPMLARPLPAPFDSDQHLFEPWWGGERALVMIGPADRRAWARCGWSMRPGTTWRARCRSWPGSPSGSPRARPSSTASSWSSTARGGRTPRELKRRLSGAAGAPSAFLAFDLLHLDGRSLLSQPLVRRREALRRVLRPGDEVVAVPAIAGEGDRPLPGGRRPGDRRDHGPPALEPLPAGRPQPAVAVRGGRRSRDRRRGAADGGAAAASPGAVVRWPTGPVLALISRLPFEDLDA